MVQIWLKTVLKWPKYDLEKVQKWSKNSSNDSKKILFRKRKEIPKEFGVDKGQVNWSSLILTVKMLSCGLTRRIRLLISKIIEKLKGKAMKRCEKISNCGLCNAKPKKSHSDLLRKQALKKLWKQNAERNGDWQRRSGISHLEENCQEKENNEKIHWKHYVWTGMQNFWVDTLNCFK